MSFKFSPMKFLFTIPNFMCSNATKNTYAFSIQKGVLLDLVISIS